MIIIKNMLSKTTPVIFPGRVLIMERSVQKNETHLCGTCDITKLNPKFLFCLESPFEDLSCVPYLCHMLSNMRRRKLGFLTIIMGCALGFAAKMPWTIPPTFQSVAGVSLVSHYEWWLFQNTTSTLKYTQNDGEPWFSHQPSQIVYCINTHPVQAAGFYTHTVFLQTKVTGRTTLHWKRNR